MLALATAACATAHGPGDAQRSEPVFDAATFFAGHTVGRGALKVAFRRAEATMVEGRGHVAPDRTIVLDQTVIRGVRKPTHREWRLRPDGAGNYRGTLTDALGPVAGNVQGNRLHLTFAMKGGLRAEQWLYLDGNGRSAHNIMTFRKLGMTVARLDETITHDVR